MYCSVIRGCLTNNSINELKKLRNNKSVLAWPELNATEEGSRGVRPARRGVLTVGGVGEGFDIDKKERTGRSGFIYCT